MNNKDKFSETNFCQMKNAEHSDKIHAIESHDRALD